MSIWILTYKGKPSALGEVSRIRESSKLGGLGLCDEEEDMFLCAKTKSRAVNTFLYYMGFTFKEWQKDGFDVVRVG